MMQRTESLGTAVARHCSREIKTKDAFHSMQNSGLNFQEISSDECNSNFSEFSEKSILKLVSHIQKFSVISYRKFLLHHAFLQEFVEFFV